MDDKKTATKAGEEPAETKDVAQAPPDPLARTGKRWFLTALLVFALIALGLVLYAARAKPTEFFYVLF